MIPMLSTTLQDQATQFLEQPPFFVGWGTLALINAGLAQGKHRSGLAWFLVSLLFGPIATLLIVLLDDPSERSG
ncbi:MAG: antitermination protein NusB [Planctomycetota bacterium]